MQRNRFFTLCHYPVSLLSPTAFLPPFRMTMGGKGVIMRETVSVIRSECKGSMPLIRKPQAQLENLYLKTIFLFSQLAADKFTLQCLQLVG